MPHQFVVKDSPFQVPLMQLLHLYYPL
jgi:hypothetical protein